MIPENNARPLVIAVGDQDRQYFFEYHSLVAFAYDKLQSDLALPSARNRNNGPASSPVVQYGLDTDPRLDPRLYELGLEGRRAVILAPPYVGPRKNDPSNLVEELLRDEGARVTIVPDEYGEMVMDAYDSIVSYEFEEHYEDANFHAVQAIKDASQTYGAFKRSRSHGHKAQILVDGVLFRAQNHIAFGGAGQGKTMFACFVSSELIKAGETVVYLDRENGEARIFERMLALGCTDEQLEEHFYYFGEPASTLDDAPDYREMLAEVKPALVVFDSLFGFMTAAGLDENHGPHIGSWFDAYAPPDLEVATLILDHTPKKGDTERGSGRKRDAVDVSWQVRGNFSTDRVGPLKLTLKKARDGGLAEEVKFTFGGTPLRAQRGDFRKLAPHERTLELLEDGMTNGEWLDAINETVSEATYFRHKEKLLKEGRVRVEGKQYFHAEDGPELSHESE